MNFRQATLVLVLVLALVVGVAVFDGYLFSQGVEQSPRCPDCNVVLISVDTLRADHLGAYGYHRNTSPAVDRLAGRGTLFENAFSQSSHTLTSHFSMFTSLYPSSHGVTPPAPDDRGFSENFTLLAEALSDSGYRTFSYNGGANVRGGLGFRRGFDTYRSNYTRKSVHPDNSFDSAYRFIEDRTVNRSRPFFLFYHTYQVHDPYYPPERFVDDFEDINRSIREEAHRRLRAYQTNGSYEQPDFRFRWEFMAPRMENSSRWRRHAVASYDADIRYTDRFVRRLVNLLERRGIRNNTVIVFTSDHGEQFGEHGSWYHWQLFQELIHVPLIVDIPGYEGGRVSEMVGGVDVSPTILEIVNVSHREFQGQQEGVSLLPVMRGEKRADGFIKSHHYTGQNALIDVRERFKYYNNSHGGWERVYTWNGSRWSETDNRSVLRRMRRLSAEHVDPSLLRERLKSLDYVQ